MSFVINPFWYGFPLARSAATSAWSSGRKIWQDSASPIYSLTGSLVDSAIDQSGNGHTLGSSGTNRPTFATGIGPQSRDAFQFDGVNDELTGSGISTLFTNSTGWAVASVYPTALTLNDSLSYRNHCVFEDTGAFMALTFRSGGTAYGFNWDGTEKKAPSNSGDIVVNTSYVVEWRHESGTVYVRVNTTAHGSLEYSAASGNTTTMTGQLTWGGPPLATPARFFTGYMFEGLTCSTIPTLGVRNAVVRNLMDWCGA